MKIGNQGDGGGRPPVEFTAEQVIELKALSAVLNKSQVADYFGISENTLRAIEKRQPEVSAAYKKGRVNQIAGMGSNLIKLAKAGMPPCQFMLATGCDDGAKPCRLAKRRHFWRRLIG